MDSTEHSPSPGEASDSDFYDGARSPMRQPAPASPKEDSAGLHHSDHVTAPTVHHHRDEDGLSDASSEMDLSSDSSPPPETEPDQDMPEPEPKPSPLSLPFPLPQPAAESNGLKRSHEESADATNSDAQSSGFPNQRRKLATRPSYASLARARQTPPLATVHRLPVQSWQQVFSLLSPVQLAQCLRVSRAFNHILTTVKAAPVPKKAGRRPRIVDSDAVWAQARKTHFPGVPRPLVGLSELQMYQLIAGNQCQSCGTKSTTTPTATTPFDCGPGPNCARPIWPYRAVLCGACLQTNTQSDVKLLCTPAASLRSGIPHIFLTTDGHYVTEYQRTNGGIHAQIHPQKVYYQRDIDDIIKDRDEVQSFGHGAADEWQKGLRTKGIESMNDAMRWESWEHRLRAKGRERVATTMRSDDAEVALAPGADLTKVIRLYHFSLPQFHRITQQRNTDAATDGPRQPRDAAQIQADMAARKVEIVRRCMELDPPIQADALPYMTSYKNAMMIAQPMTDPAWEVLKPLLLAQRDEAEQIAHKRQADLAALESTVPFDYQSEMRPAREVYSEDYERAQDPLRRKLSQYADDFRTAEWGQRSLDYHSSVQFATECLLYVDRAYQSAKAAGESFNGPQTTDHGSRQGTPSDPFLSLDNMKWVYDHKVRPQTDVHRRELFVCADCAEEGKPYKAFAFEGLIQHYGAKHTTAFSRANIVVHWQTAAWPEDPPFAVGPAAKDTSHPGRSGKFAHRGGSYNGHGNGNGGARKSSGAIREDTFRPPAVGTLLSDNPYFAQPREASQQVAPHDQYSLYAMNNGGYGYNHIQYHSQPYGQGYQTAMPPEPRMDLSDAAQIEKLSTDAREIWDALEDVEAMLPPIKIHTVLHHTVKRFYKHFGHAPVLDTVTDALATNATIRPVKNAIGLYCKSCVLSQSGGNLEQKSYFERTMNVKSFNVGSLITHFKIVHQQQLTHAHWTTEMLELPETKLVKMLQRTPGMDDAKLAIVAAAFPYAFPLPLPTIGVIPKDSEIGADGSLASRLIDRMMPSLQDKKRRKKNHGAHIATPAREGSNSEPLPEAKDDEYDPRRPAYVQSEEQVFDPARFDTDLSRRKVSVSNAPNGTTDLNLLPETLAALNNLNQYTAQRQRERSPSVGAPEHPQSSSNAALDITAILATLTGEPQSSAAATPPASMSTRSGSAPRQHYADPSTYAQHTAPQQQNSRAYEYNRQPTYAPPIEYVQLAPEYRHSPPQHQGRAQYIAPPQPQRIFVDENGRQVFAVPIDDPPPPRPYDPYRRAW